MNTCAECGLDIASRGHNAIYCVPCVRKRERTQRSEKTLYQSLATSFVTVAIRHGDLPKLDGSIACVDCGNPAAEYDHRDYRQPLDVQPVCRSCNQKRGPGKHKDPRETGNKQPSILRRYRDRAAA